MTPPESHAPAPPAPPTSPRLAALQEALADGGGGALEGFWAEAEAQGTPLIEPLPGDAAHVLVTFLWRGDATTATVVVASPLVGWDYAQNRLHRLGTTDVWYRSYPGDARIRTVYLFLLDLPPPAQRPPEGFDEQPYRRADPLNPRPFVVPLRDRPPWAGSVLELPQAPPQPWSAPRPGVPRGRLRHHRVASRTLGNERDVWVYTPPGYDPDGPPHGFLLVFDGRIYHRVIPTPTILDNLLAAGRGPPLVALLVDNAGRAARPVEFASYPPFNCFLVDELLPWARARYRLAADPARCAVAGSSLGGQAALYAGLRHADRFGNVLSQSGAVGWIRPLEGPPPEARGEGWLLRQVAARPRLPLRLYLDVGTLEPAREQERNRRLRDTLRAKGYPVHSAEFHGGHDYLSWVGTLADGLLALLGRPPGGTEASAPTHDWSSRTKIDDVAKACQAAQAAVGSRVTV